MIIHGMATKIHNNVIRNIHKVRLKFDTEYRENHEYMVKRMAEVLREVLKEK